MMTPTMEIKEMTENAPEELKDRLKCAIIKLTEDDCKEILIFLKERLNDYG